MTHNFMALKESRNMISNKQEFILCNNRASSVFDSSGGSF